MWIILLMFDGLGAIWNFLAENATVLSIVVTAIATTFVAVFTVELATVTARSVNLARQEFDANHRPWVSAKVSADSDIIVSGDAVTMHLRVKLKNTRNSPALNVMQTAAMFPGDTVNVNAWQARSANSRARTQDPNARVGFTLFPGQSRTVSTFVAINLNSYEVANLDKERPGWAAFIMPHAFGCVTYVSGYGTKGETGWCSLVLKKTPSTNGNFGVQNMGHGIRRDQKVVPQDDIVFPEHITGNYAK